MVDVGSLLVVPFGRRELLGVVVGPGRAQRGRRARLLAPLRALDRLAVPAGRPGRARRVDRARSTARPSRARYGWCCRRGRRAARRPRRAQAPGAGCAAPAPRADRGAALRAAAADRGSAAGARGDRRLAGIPAHLTQPTGSGSRRRPGAAAAARRDRLGQDGDLPARRGARAGAGSRRDRAGPRDRADAADRGALRGALRRDRRGAPLAPVARRSARRVAAAARRARRASASARARRCSRRSRTSG